MARWVPPYGPAGNPSDSFNEAGLDCFDPQDERYQYQPSNNCFQDVSFSQSLQKDGRQLEHVQTSITELPPTNNHLEDTPLPHLPSKISTWSLGHYVELGFDQILPADQPLLRLGDAQRAQPATLGSQNDPSSHYETFIRTNTTNTTGPIPIGYQFLEQPMMQPTTILPPQYIALRGAAAGPTLYEEPLSSAPNSHSFYPGNIPVSRAESSLTRQPSMFRAPTSLE
jgi:hypothetical protein